MKAARFDYVRVTTCAEAARLLAHSNGMGKVVAGWQSLGPMLNLRLAQPELLVDVTAIAELAAVRREPDAITLGACTRHAAIEDGVVPDVTAGLMPFVAHGIAYRAVRNRGTLGGSLAHADPAADWVSVMALLDAQCVVVGTQGPRTVAWADWMQGAFTTALAEDEVLTAVRIPALSPTARWSYEKWNRKPGEFAHAIAAFLCDPARGISRAVIGGTDGAPHVVHDARSLLDERHAEAAVATLAGARIEPATFEYRIHEVTLKRAARRLRDMDRRAA